MRIRTYSRADILQKFHAQCQSLAANNNSGYQREFEELNETGKEYSRRVGELDANKEKNRYPIILPYDYCRVRLSLLESQPHSDYINASYVPGGCTEHDFICTQAPLPLTMADFWRMVWEQNVNVIIMVTALKENGKVLCNQYWPPERGTGCYGSLQVTTVSRHHGPDCYITTIYLRQHGYTTDRQVTHYHYPGWPDQGVPKDIISLCAFTEHVRKQLDDCPGLGPTVVHCSAGVGRSGTFVALLWLMQLSVRGVLPDVRLAVQDLRRHRTLMVQNLEQYMLVHQGLLHWLGGSVSRPSTQNSVHFQTTQPHRHFKRDQRSRRRYSDHALRPESAYFSHQVSHTPQPEQTKTQHTPQPQHTTKTQRTPQPKGTPQHQHTPLTQQPHQHTTWQSLQHSLHTFHPGKLLQRILPQSSRLSSQTPHNA